MTYYHDYTLIYFCYFLVKRKKASYTFLLCITNFFYITILFYFLHAKRSYFCSYIFKLYALSRVILLARYLVNIFSPFSLLFIFYIFILLYIITFFNTFCVILFICNFFVIFYFGIKKLSTFDSAKYIFYSSPIFKRSALSAAWRASIISSIFPFIKESNWYIV